MGPTVTASVGLVSSGQHLEHNAQRQKAPTHTAPHLAVTIEGIQRKTFNGAGSYLAKSEPP